MGVVVAPRKYPEELRGRAVWLAVEARRDPVSRPGACRRIGEQLGINPETLRGWVTSARSVRGAATTTVIGGVHRDWAAPHFSDSGLNWSIQMRRIGNGSRQEDFLPGVP